MRGIRACLILAVLLAPLASLSAGEVRLTTGVTDLLVIDGVSLLPLTSVPTVLTPGEDPRNGNAVTAWGQVTLTRVELTPLATVPLTTVPLATRTTLATPATGVAVRRPTVQYAPPLPVATLSAGLEVR